LDDAFLAGAGWDPDRQVLTPPPQHPTLGYTVCMVAECNVVTKARHKLCHACENRWRTSGLAWPAFLTVPPVRERTLGEFICEVGGCDRPRRTVRASLCDAHHAQHTGPFKGLAIEEFLVHPAVRPFPSFGDCRVPSCIRRAKGHRGLCHPHAQRWRSHRSRHPDAELLAWCDRQHPISEGHAIVLRGLPELLRTELLYGLQERSRQGLKTKPWAVRALCRGLREARAGSIAEFTSTSSRDAVWLAAYVQRSVTRALSSPEEERRKDVWDLATFGHRGTVNFTALSQPWLRAAMMHWVDEELPRRRGHGVASTMQAHVNAMRELSVSLRLHRTDRGMLPNRLHRADIVAFTNRLSHLEATGGLSAKQRIRICRMIGRLLRDWRALGLTRAGQSLHGLPDDFALRPGDVPEEPDDDEAGRALPEEVLRQLIAALPQLEARSSREIRVAVQLLMDTGRRPDEICSLPWDCLERGADGKHLLVYTNHKANRVNRRLPIGDNTAALMREQQRRVRDRFADTAVDELVLLPRSRTNPFGRHSVHHDIVTDAHRVWVDSLPPLLLDAVDDQGNQIAFDKARVFPYLYRHCFAQRHADAGTPVDVLCELMDHASMDTTRGYYRVTEKRTRAAVDKLAAFQFNGRGERVWRQAEQLLDSEHQRLRIGQVAVPFGICTEPSNVKAGGHACPFRFRCHGCGHFRTDPSYLPELRAYLDRLLADRERVRATTELEDWAREEATPSETEIAKVRGLIRKIEQDLDGLDDDDRRQIQEAVRAVRATRQTVHLGMPSVRPPAPDLRPEVRP